MKAGSNRERSEGSQALIPLDRDNSCTRAAKDKMSIFGVTKNRTSAGRGQAPVKVRQRVNTTHNETPDAKTPRK